MLSCAVVIKVFMTVSAWMNYLEGCTCDMEGGSYRLNKKINTGGAEI